jgi:flagella basal body P-ring formation protein FlgA
MKPGFSESFLLLFASATMALAGPPVTADPTAWRLLAQAQSHAAGIYLDELIEAPATPLPHIRLASAPAVGQAVILTRAQITGFVRQTSPEFAPTNWTGSSQVRITRRMRLLEEAEIREALTSALQHDFVKERGELELRLARPWPTASIADELFTVNILDLPSTGVTPSFVLRFELRSGSALLGNWQVPVQAHIWREVCVAGSPLLRGQLLRNADITKERRDMLTARDALLALEDDEEKLELAENLPAGAVLTARSLRLRPVMRRGKVVEALIQEGALTISIKAEVLEDGVPGQTVRARNLQSKREFRGKVQNEETIVVAL